jgi:hypothetical protein
MQELEALLSPRDRFAFHALNGLLSRHGTAVKADVTARMAYEIADAMMQARGTDSGAKQLLRDRIAEEALNGLVANQGSAVKAAVVARMAYELADALLAARGAHAG